MEKEQSHSSSFLSEHMENYDVEASALHRKLQSKVEALRIMRESLEKFRTERDQFKLMAETLQLRYSTIKRSSDYNFAVQEESSVASLLRESRENNFKLTTENEALKQKLNELEGDIKLLRSSNKNNVKSNNEHERNTQEYILWKQEKTLLLKNFEELKAKFSQLTYDLKAVIDEKEEAITDRDNYKYKAHRLNHELLVALKANETHPKMIDIDGILFENKYLQQKIHNYESEIEILNQLVNKYMKLFESKSKNGIISLGTNNLDNIMSHKQVKMLLEKTSDIPINFEATNSKSVSLSLVDYLNDQTLALNHQKRTNKILATRICELEQRILTITNQTDLNTFSPSQILLSNYDAENIDYEKKSLNATDNSEKQSYYTNNRQLNASKEIDDSISSKSRESVNSSKSTESVNSSASCNSIQSSNSDSSVYVYNNCQDLTVNAILKERIEDLKDLPFDLADMVQKRLEELDAESQTVDCASENS